MTIKAISTSELHDECNGCRAENIFAVTNLFAGFPNARDLIALPPCSACGAITALQREPDNTPENRQHLYDTEQHGAVNALHAFLAAAGRIHPGMSEADVDRLSAARASPGLRMMPLASSLAIVRSEAEEFPQIVVEG